MKELKLFESWADSISKSYVTEFVAPDKKKNSRAMNSSIQSIAQRQYPDLSPEEALITYMGQKLADMEAKDAEQIKLINRQSQETNKLMNTVQGIRAAYDDLERSSQEVEQEIEQIRGGAERVKSGQEQSSISAREVQELLRTVEELKKNPSVDKSEYAELVNSVKGLKDSNVSKDQYEELKQQIEQAHNEQAPELGEIHADIERLKQEYSEKVAGAGKLRNELEALLKSDPKLLGDNPTIKNMQDNLLYQKNMAKNLLGSDDTPNGIRAGTNLTAILQANGYENGILDALAKGIIDTEEKLENLPDEEELAKLKTIPDKVEKIRLWADKNEEMDEEQNIYLDLLKNKDANPSREHDSVRNLNLDPYYHHGKNRHLDDLHSTDTERQEKAKNFSWDKNVADKDRLKSDLSKHKNEISNLPNDIHNYIGSNHESLISSIPRMSNLAKNFTHDRKEKTSEQQTKDWDKLINHLTIYNNNIRNLYSRYVNSPKKENHEIAKDILVNWNDKYIPIMQQFADLYPEFTSYLKDRSKNNSKSSAVMPDNSLKNLDGPMAAYPYKTIRMNPKQRQLPTYDKLPASQKEYTMGELLRKRRAQGYAAESTNLPESYLNAIDTMAENILGEQYGKYLK